MVLANHPYAVDRGGQAVGYMADTFLVTPEGGKASRRSPSRSTSVE